MAVYKLGDIIILNQTFKQGEEIKYLELSGIGDFSIKTIKNHQIPSRAKWDIDKDTIIIGRVRPLNKNHNIYRDTERIVGSSGFTCFKSDNVNVLNDYLWFALQSVKFLSYTSDNAKGSTYPEISQKDLFEYKFFAPSLSEQEKIIEIIKPAENLFLKYPNLVRIDSVENCEKDIKDLIEIIKPFEDLLVKLNMLKMNILNIISNIPCSNKKFTLSSVSSIENNAPKGIHQVSAKIMKKRDPSIYNLESPGTYKSNSFFAPKGTLLINTIRPNLNKFCILPTDADYNGTNLAVKINSKQTAIIKSLINNDFWEQCILLTKGTKMPIISKNDLLHTVIFEDVKTEIPDLFKIFQKINYLELKIEETKKELISLLIK